MSLFPIIQVPYDASERIEDVGSKPKFWYTRHDDTKWLYKANRPGTGEDWAEKVAAELCTLLDLPHALYDFAIQQETRGVVTKSVVTPTTRLTLGNEVLYGMASDYPRYEQSGFRRIKEHTLSLVLGVFDEAIDPPMDWRPQGALQTARDVFVGYLLLDAWIGNSDRHDQNWALLEGTSSEVEHRSLAPTFDHASSLGRELQDEEREARLTTNDQGYSVEHYASRARSAMYRTRTDRKPMLVRALFEQVLASEPDAARAWLDRLADVSNQATLTIFDRIPPQLISEVGIEFAVTVLNAHRRHLLSLR